jgi:hypothetical protein
MKNTSTIKKTGSLLVALLLLLIACDKQGPMGPEGPPGPDGANSGGGGGGGFSTYFVENELEPFWEKIGAWGDHGVYNLAIGPYRWLNDMPLPDTAVSTINNGGLILVYLKIGDTWRSLPFKDGFHNGEGIYDYYFNYEVKGGKIAISAKALDDVEVDIDKYAVQRIKIVVAPASTTIPLKL